MDISRHDKTVCLNDIWEDDYNHNKTVDPVKWINSKKGKMHKSKIKGCVVDKTIRYTTSKAISALYKAWAEKLLQIPNNNRKQSFKYCLTDFWIEQHRPKGREPSNWTRYGGKGYKTYKNSIKGVNKTYTDDSLAFEMYKKWVLKDEESNYRFSGVREKAALATIEQLLGIELIKQFPVFDGKYRIDGYDPVANVAYEIDEEQHFTSKNVENDRIREEEIRNELHCKFVRIRV